MSNSNAGNLWHQVHFAALLLLGGGRSRFGWLLFIGSPLCWGVFRGHQGKPPCWGIKHPFRAAPSRRPSPELFLARTRKRCRSPGRRGECAFPNKGIPSRCFEGKRQTHASWRLPYLEQTLVDETCAIWHARDPITFSYAGAKHVLFLTTSKRLAEHAVSTNSAGCMTVLSDCAF